jgi:hypothetical protein
LEKLSFTGRQFEEMSDREKEQILAGKQSMVFSRAEPKHKQVSQAVRQNPAVWRAACAWGLMSFIYIALRCSLEAVEEEPRASLARA